MTFRIYHHTLLLQLVLVLVQMLAILPWTALVVAHLASQTVALPFSDHDLQKRDEQNDDTTPPLITTWPGKPYVTFILTDKDTGDLGRNTKVLDIANWYAEQESTDKRTVPRTDRTWCIRSAAAQSL